MKKSVLKEIDNLIGIKIAHRGLWNEKNPENSLGAFKECVDRNIPIELDVHILKDNTLVVFHDADTLRMTGEKIVLKNANYDDIKNLKLLNTEYNIPTFKEVLDLVDGRVLLDIEIKGNSKGFRICNEICRYLDRYKGNFIVKSFNLSYVLWFKTHRKNFIRGILISNFLYNKKKDVFKYILFNIYLDFIIKPDFIAFNHKKLPNKMIDKFMVRGVPILLFTIKEEDIIFYKNYGYIYEE